jgi:hypothetical protein
MKRETEDAHIYFPVKVLNDMRKLAKENRRSVSAEMIIAAERYIAENRRPANGKGAAK